MLTPEPGTRLLLFHWSPVARRQQIIRHGLRPMMRPVVSTPGWKPPYTCFAESPSWAWALSGAMHPEVSAWDLWQTWLGCLTDVEFLETADADSGYDFHEIRSHARVYKRSLWWVGSRATNIPARGHT